jgi:2-keto-4-pentenoate hydratase/2-oxohepta-3-ene-1,7-dioic acid hydratase in catechol pathway
VKLCRFALTTDPDTVRSGLYYEGRFYETEGNQPIAIHEADTARLLPPLITAPSVRAFQSVPDGSTASPGYRHLNAARLYGSQTSLPWNEEAGELDLECRVAAVIGDNGAWVRAEESPNFILGYVPIIVLRMPEVQAQDERHGMTDGAGYDVAQFYGPVITTPEELADIEGVLPTSYRWSYRLKISGDLVAEGEEVHGPYGSSVCQASQFGPVHAGELLAGPAFPIPPLIASPISRSLQEGDTIEFDVQRLGRLVVRIGN